MTPLQVLSALLWTLQIAALEASIWSKRMLASILLQESPETLDTFRRADLNRQENNRQFSRFIWTREYLALNNPAVTKWGNQARGYWICATLSGTALLEYYFFRFFLHP